VGTSPEKGFQRNSIYQHFSCVELSLARKKKKKKRLERERKGSIHRVGAPKEPKCKKGARFILFVVVGGAPVRVKKVD